MALFKNLMHKSQNALLIDKVLNEINRSINTKSLNNLNTFLDASENCLQLSQIFILSIFLNLNFVLKEKKNIKGKNILFIAFKPVMVSIQLEIEIYC